MDRTQVKQVKEFLYDTFNSLDSKDLLGGYNTRVLPVQSQITSGTDGEKDHIRMLKKHQAIIKQLKTMKTYGVRDLDVDLDGNKKAKTSTLRQILLQLPYPLYSSDIKIPKKRLFHSVDYAASGQDAKKGAVILTAYKDRAVLAEKLVDILPQFLTFAYGYDTTKKFMTHQAIQDCPEIEWDSPTYAEWKGTWTTEEERQMKALFEEDMGVAIQMEGLEILQQDAREADRIRTTDDESFASFGTHLQGKSRKTRRKDQVACDDDSSAQDTTPQGDDGVEGDVTL